MGFNSGFKGLNRRGGQFSRLLAAEVCASAVVMLDTPCCEAVWMVLATHSIRQFPLHFPSSASPCAITFQLDSTFPFYCRWHMQFWAICKCSLLPWRCNSGVSFQCCGARKYFVPLLTISITYSECVYAALVIQHVMRMCCVILSCGLPGCTLFFHIIS